MKLKNIIIVTEKFKGKTKFQFWNDLQINDILEISILLNGQGGYGKGVARIEFENKTQDRRFGTSISDSKNYLNKIKYQEI